MSRRNMTLTLMCLVFADLVSAGFFPGDTLKLRAGYADATGMSSLSDRRTLVVSSVVRSGDTTRVVFRCIATTIQGFLESGGGTVYGPALFSADSFRLAILNGVPKGVSQVSGRLRTVPWLLSDQSPAIFHSSIRALAGLAPTPILDSALADSAFSSYRTRLSDTLGLLWVDSTGNGKWIATRLRFTGAGDSVGTVVPNGRTPVVGPVLADWSRSRGQNPLGLSQVEFNTYSTALGFSTGVLGSGTYGTYLTGYVVPSLGIRKAPMGRSNNPPSVPVSADGRRGGPEPGTVVFPTSGEAPIVRP